ncbi:MAG: hypothetical protein RLZZ76_244 [Candidatus Parcubacteria bacterium]|jgi:predicted ATP-grasp superfamily ATP-dependent carboligase
MSVLILDGHLKSALAAVRSLGHSGAVVHCGSNRKWALAGYSKYTKKRFVYPSPKERVETFVNVIRMEAQTIRTKTGEKPVVFCFSDATLNALAESYDTLKDSLILSLPSHKSLLVARNKKETQALAEELAIPTIKTYKIENAAHLRFPVVVKNQESVRMNNGVNVSGTAEFATSREELEQLYKNISKTSGQAPLIQECIQGDEYGVEMVCKQGVPLATFVHRRVRSLSPRGGAAVVKETAEKNVQTEAMVLYAYVLTEKLLWTGPIMVECKVDNRDGGVRLMEINGRFWGSLPLAVKAGVDFPLIAYRLARGEETGETKEAFSSPYVRTRHFLGDVFWIWRVLFAKDKMRNQLYPSRLRALWDFKVELFRSKGDVFDVRDLKPSFVEYLGILSK